MIPAVHFFRVGEGDRLAVASVEPASAPGTWLVRVARGKTQGKLTGGTVYGPFPETGLAERFDEVVKKLEGEGFVRAGEGELVMSLSSDDPGARARAALRLGWRKDQKAVGALITALEKSKRDAPSILDALGMIGDRSAIAAVRPFAEKQLLSRRRSAVEALRTLGDVDGLAQARQRAFEKIPQEVQQVLATIDEHDVRKENLAPLMTALKAVEEKQRGLIADLLYEADTPVASHAAQRLLRSVPLERPHQWRYAKSVLKRAMLRHDARTFGWLAHAIEERARLSKGSKAELKSGLDGVKRPTTVFSKKTQAFVRRLCWRYLTRVARWRPDRYALLCAEVLVAYGPEDLRPPKGLIGRFGECYLLSRILWGKSDRFTFNTTAMRVRFKSAQKVKEPAASVREEAHPELWDMRPKSFLRIASAAELPEVLEFAARGLGRHPHVLAKATTKQLVEMLARDHEGIVKLGAGELERRFDPQKPDTKVLARLIGHDVVLVRELGARFAEQSAGVWAIDPASVVALLLAARAEASPRVCEAAIAALAKSVDARKAVAPAILKALRAPEPSEGAHGALAEVARRSLAAELDALLDTQELLQIIDSGSNAARAVAGMVLGRRPDAVGVIGLDRLRSLAESEVVAVRRGAHALIESAIESFRADPAPLFVLAESAWKDTREVAFAMLRAIGFEKIGLDGLIGLCDSSQPDARALGRELVKQHFDQLDPQEVLFRLVEHPARDMRGFALELIEGHLKPGFVPLSRIEGFCRGCLLDLSPDRGVKRRLIAFLEGRGTEDERQAEVVVAILSAVVRTHTIADFQRVLGALARVQLAFPSAARDVRLAP